MRPTLQHGWDRMLAAVVLMTAPCVCGCGKPAAQCYATPEEVMAAEQAAYKDGDWSTYVDCFTPESHEKLIKFALPFHLAGPLSPIAIKIEGKGGKQAITGKGEITTPFSLSNSTAAEKTEKQKRYEEFRTMCARHGLTDWKKRDGETAQRYGERLAAQIKDKRAFLVDFWTYTPLPDRDKALRNNLTEVKIDGDSACGVFGHSEGKGRQWEKVEFKKIAGSWRIENPGIGH